MTWKIHSHTRFLNLTHSLLFLLFVCLFVFWKAYDRTTVFRNTRELFLHVYRNNKTIMGMLKDKRFLALLSSLSLVKEKVLFRTFINWKALRSKTKRNNFSLITLWNSDFKTNIWDNINQIIHIGTFKCYKKQDTCKISLIPR